MYQIISRGANKYCTAKRTVNETPVQPISVLMTPQQALDMTAEGIPVSAQMANADLFYDGDEHSDFIPLDRRRGVDIADMYNEQRDIEDKFNNHFNGFRKKRREQEGGE